MIKILNAEPVQYSRKACSILQSIGELHERVLTRSELIAGLKDFDVLIVRLGFQVNREIIDAGHRLKVIVTATTGLDHIDVTYAESRGITVLSLKGEIEFLRSVPATAEHTWALLLALRRRIAWAYQSVLDGQWDRDVFRGHELKDKRLGLVGFGRVGEQVACYGLAFGMLVGAYDPYREVTPLSVTRFDTLNGLLTWSDIVSLHVLLNKETFGLIGRQEFNLMQAGAILVNTSRGAVINESALLQALVSGHLGGAALDVICNEITLTEHISHPLISYARTHNNLLITPHLSGATYESMEQTELFMANKLKAFLAKA